MACKSSLRGNCIAIDEAQSHEIATQPMAARNDDTTNTYLLT